MKKILAILFLIPVLLFAQNNSSILRSRIDSMRNLLSGATSDSMRAKLYLSLSNQMGSANLDSAIGICKQGLVAAEKCGHKKLAISCHNLLGNFFQRRSQFTEALKEYELNLKLLQGMNNKAGMSIMYGGIANCYGMKGELDSAVKYRLAAVKMAEASGSKKSIAAAHGNLGELYFTMKNYPKALESFRYHLKLSEEIGDRGGMIIPLSNVAYALMQTGKSEEALPLLLKALSFANETGNHEGLSVVLNNLGTIYLERKEAEKASGYFKQSLQVADEIGDEMDAALAYVALGEINLDQHNYQQALSYFEKAYQKARPGEMNERMQNALLGMATAYEKLGKSTEALKYFKKYSENKDSMLNEDIARQVTEMTTRYETEKKENQIKLLNKESELQKTEAARKEAEFAVMRNSLIIGSVLLLLIFIGVLFFIRNRRAHERIKMEKQVIELEQQALRLQMNPHFIFNSLSSINNFIGKNEAAEAKKFLTKFSKLMRLILENSREEFVPIQKEIESLQYYMDLEQLRSGNKFDFELQLDGQIDPENLLIPPMLIQPHLENAVLHGIMPKEGKGKILLSFTKKNGGLVCIIEDNGVGRKKASEIKAMEGSTHRSLALAVTQERLTILNSEETKIQLEDLYENEKASGTRIKFTLPVKESI